MVNLVKVLAVLTLSSATAVASSIEEQGHNNNRRISLRNLQDSLKEGHVSIQDGHGSIPEDDIGEPEESSSSSQRSFLDFIIHPLQHLDLTRWRKEDNEDGAAEIASVQELQTEDVVIEKEPEGDAPGKYSLTITTSLDEDGVDGDSTIMIQFGKTKPQPTAAPSLAPSLTPTDVPSSMPSYSPSLAPSDVPSPSPSSLTTDALLSDDGDSATFSEQGQEGPPNSVAAENDRGEIHAISEGEMNEQPSATTGLGETMTTVGPILIAVVVVAVAAAFVMDRRRRRNRRPENTANNRAASAAPSAESDDAVMANRPGGLTDNLQPPHHHSIRSPNPNASSRVRVVDIASLGDLSVPHVAKSGTFSPSHLTV